MNDRKIWDVLTPTQKNKWLMDELCCQLRLGVKTLSDETLVKLGVSDLALTPGTKYMVSRYAYDMLVNPRYQEKLLYSNGTLPVDVSHIVSEYSRLEVRRYDCDLIIMATKYAFFAEHFQKGGEFSVPSLYKKRPADSKARYEEIYSLLSNYKITRRLLKDSKAILFADDD